MDESVLTLKEAIFWAAGILSLMTVKFLSWFMPETAALWLAKIRKWFIGDLEKELIALAGKVDVLIVENSSYKAEKHKIEGELKECKDAIISDDTDKLKVLKDHYAGK